MTVFRVLPLALVLGLVGRARAADSMPADCLWYAQPAAQWNNALPIGNGRMGAMVFGGVPDERIQFNEDTLWKGHPHDYDRPDAVHYLPEIRRLLAEGKQADAEKLARAHFLGDPVRQMAYQPFGDLRLHFAGEDNVTDYRRELDLDSAVARVTYRAGGVAYTRDAFASYPDRVIVLHIAADRPGSVSLTLRMDSPHPGTETRAVAADTLALSGRLGPDGLRFESRVRVIAEGGQVVVDGRGITVAHADAVTFLLTAATSFKNYQDISADPAARCVAVLARLTGRSYDSLRAAQLADYRNLFDRVRLDLGHTARADLPTDQRLELARTGGLEGDPALPALYFAYGRYLLIACSRPGGQPANLQGVWNEDLNPPWESKWTTNINLEMNYWPAEVTNLDECAQPLFALIRDLSVAGRRTAKDYYGCPGWVEHHNTDLWRGTAPVNNVDGVWPTGGAWLCHLLWEHWLFTGDKEFLARAYPILKSASEFFECDLVRDPKTGWLISSPSFSPEQGGLVAGPTMDHQLIRALMDATVRAAGILGVDQAFAAKLADVCRQIAPNQIGRYGQLQEWLTDIDVPNNHHRHMSPLWALYPGEGITPTQPKLFAAAKKLLAWRGDGSTGWSYAWRIALWARAGDGAFAYRQLSELFARRTLPNLFDLCGPFQIDGNFGATAGIAELLLQSQWHVPGQPDTPEINLLPALPVAWPDGAVTGLRARGGFTVDLAWNGGALTRVVIRSELGRACRLEYAGKTLDLQTQPGGRYAFDGQLRPEPKPRKDWPTKHTE